MPWLFKERDNWEDEVWECSCLASDTCTILLIGACNEGKEALSQGPSRFLKSIHCLSPVLEQRCGCWHRDSVDSDASSVRLYPGLFLSTFWLFFPLCLHSCSCNFAVNYIWELDFTSGLFFSWISLPSSHADRCAGTIQEWCTGGKEQLLQSPPRQGCCGEPVRGLRSCNRHEGKWVI